MKPELSALPGTLSSALVLTVVIEGTITLCITRKARYLLFNLWCNALTNPLLNLMLFGIRCLTDTAWIYWCCVLLGEIAVLFAEFAVYRLADTKKQNTGWYFRLSLVTNAVSFSLGEILALILSP